MRYMKVLASVVATFLLLPNSVWAQDELSFTRKDIPLQPIHSPRELVSSDFNGDGRVDLVIGTTNGFMSQSSQMYILIGKGDGGFESPRSVYTGSESTSILAADFNSDGLQDLSTASIFSETVAILLGNGDGTFQSSRDLNLGESINAFSSVAGDLNGDGVLDLAISVIERDSDGGGNVHIYLGNGDGTFTRNNVIEEGTPRALILGDFNGDGDRDIAAIDYVFEHNTVLILLGHGDGTFEPVSQQSVIAPEAYTLAVGDFDGDGQQDLASSDLAESLAVLMGNGDGTFGAARYFQPGRHVEGLNVSPASLRVADMNSDGLQDLVTGNLMLSDPQRESSVSILLGRGDGTFESAKEFATQPGTWRVVVADFNNDGKPDLATNNDDSSSLTILTAGAVCVAPLTATSASPPAPPSSESPGASTSSNRNSSGGGSLGSELWLLSAILLGGYVRRRANKPSQGPP